MSGQGFVRISFMTFVPCNFAREKQAPTLSNKPLAKLNKYNKARCRPHSPLSRGKEYVHQNVLTKKRKENTLLLTQIRSFSLHLGKRCSQQLDTVCFEHYSELNKTLWQTMFQESRFSAALWGLRWITKSVPVHKQCVCVCVCCTRDQPSAKTTKHWLTSGLSVRFSSVDTCIDKNIVVCDTCSLATGYHNIYFILQTLV